MRLFLTLTLGLGLSFSSLLAQNAPDFWGRISPDAVVLTGNAERQVEPLQYAAFTLDYQQVVTHLSNAPREYTAIARQRTFRVTLPLADGKKEAFSVVKTRVMDAALEALHPEIGTYAGESMTTPGMQVRITVTPGWGLQAMITRADKGIEYIEPVAKGQNQYYMAYDRLNLPRDIRSGQLPTMVVPPNETLQETAMPRYAVGEPAPGEGEKLLGSQVNLKVYKFACAANSGFSIDNGGTKQLVFEKITSVTNQLNAIYERDINIRLQLIAESFDIIFIDPATDPYLGTDVIGWMNQNPQIMLQYLGSPDKYDIGHMFARYLGGPAIGVSGSGYCCTQFKARGCSSWYGPPYADEFFAIVGQEIGHQWRSGHTFNQCLSDSQFDYDSACEPGSGSTIMSYSGSCGSNNVSTGNTALFYHACSIAEIRRFVEFQEGNTCGSTLATTNTAPMASTAYPPVLFIPISTPFELTGSATDMDGDPVTYSWDQIDVGPTGPLGSPTGSAPLFRWFEPTTNPTRTFPRIQTVISNNFSTTEVLPTTDRDITFAFVVRDNKPGGGGIGMDTVDIRSTPLAGPFLITYPSASNIKWKVGEYQTIVWDVANTNNAPVNAKIVNIKLSTDNGITYPITLATGIPNNGKYCIQVPNNVGTNLRIRVEAADNVFFDISNTKFAVEQPTASISLCAALGKDYACLPTNYTTQISTVGLAGLSDPITLSASGLPSGATASFSPNPVQPGTSATMTVYFPDNSPENTFDLTVSGNAGAASATSIITLTVVNNDFSTFSTIAPANGAAGVILQPLLTWNGVPDADLYDVELATNPSFAPTVLVSSKENVAATSFQVPVMLEEGKVYYWHVRPKNACGAGEWSAVQVFVVAIQSCGTLAATDLPKPISANGTPTVESKITLATGGAISDINVKKIQGSHTFFKDLEVRLIGPSGTNVLLWKDKCASNVSFNVGMDDSAAGPFGCPPPNTGVAYKPAEPLSAFNGESSAGVWTLRVKDNVQGSGGTLAAFELEICSSVALNPPLIATNSPLTLPSGANAVIGDNLLKANDANNGPSSLIFSLMSLPAHGQLTVNGVIASLGSQFTQADISNGGLRYFDYGLQLGQDNFNFSVTDGEGGLANGTFLVQPTVGIRELDARVAFDLSPNPASASALLSLNQPLSSDARVTVLNVAGQAVTTLQLPAGAYSLRLELNGLPKGVYAVSLESEKLKSIKKLVVQ